MSGIQQLLLSGSQAAAPAVDPYFYSVTSLLHGDGTNGGQNNTFLDSSTNNFTITRNGNTTQGSFSPFSQTGWSVAGGNGDGFVITQTTNTDLGSGDFCVEAFVYLNSLGSNNTIITKRKSDGALAGSWILEINSAGNVTFGGVGSGTSITGTGPISVGQWTHVVGCRTGSTLSVFANGVRVGTTTATDNYSCSTNTFIKLHGNNGGEYPAGGALFGGVNGHINNLRVVVGSNPYSASSTTLTVPTGNLTAITNTKLLFAQSNRFVDNSSVGQTLSIYASPAIQPFSPFNPTTAYSTSAVGGSGYFDGSGDYLNLASNTAFNCGTGNFTVEGWVYINSYPGSYPLIIGNNNGGFSTGAIALTAQNSTSGGASKISLSVYDINSGAVTLAAASTNQLTSWIHVALVRNGTSLVLYINGASSASTTISAGVTFDWGKNGLLIGGGNWDGANSYFAGYISSLRLVKGTAVYTADFTPPTAPLTAITNTSLLCNFTNGAIFDNAAVADYETAGNAQISTSVKKYGTGSMSFDGTGDYLVSPGTQSLTFGTGDFTIEFWLYLNVLNTDQLIFDMRPASTQGAYPALYFADSGDSLNYYVDGNIRITSGAITSGVWYHVAICRTASQTKMFINGTQVGSTYADTTNYLCNRLVVGAQSFTLGNGPLNGYIDDMRISKGIARYTYNFTPPAAELPNIGGTVTLTADPYYEYTTLLLPGNGTNGAQNNTFLDSSTNAFSITRNGNTTQGTFSPFSQTGWGNYFDGSGDYLSVPNNAVLAYGTGDFTVEFWINRTGAVTSTDCGVIDQRNGVNGAYFMCGVDPNQQFFVYLNSAYRVGPSAATTLALGAWYHIAYVRSGTTGTLYINGTSVGSWSDNLNYATNTVLIGRHANGGGDFPGYLSNIRILKGTAQYTANFTPPTAPLTAITNTSLLTCQSNRFIDNSTNALTITPNGGVSVQAFSPFNPTAAWSAATNGGSGYFDGSGDYLSLADNAAFNMGTGNFTAEFWLYTADQTNNYPGIISASVYSDTGAISVRYDNTGHAKKIFIYLAGASPSDPLVTSSAYEFGQWIHVAIVRDSTTALKIYVNGTLDGTGTITSGQVVDFSGANSFYIGRGFDVDGGAAYLAGYISSVRLVKGTAVYTGNFTPPTGPLTAIANTSFLCNFTNAGIYDATSKNDLETVGNAQISTTQSKFGGSSMYFDGTGDYLVGPSSQNFALGTGDCTVEFWSYYTGTYATEATVFDSRVSPFTNGFAISMTATNGYWMMNFTVQDILTSIQATQNQWQHIAVTRYGNTFRLFVNGVLGGSVTSTNNLSNTTIRVGANYNNANTFVGYINDLRITKGIARYTSNFTPPSTAFLTL